MDDKESATHKKDITDFYVLGEEIGRGSFSVVRKGKHKESSKLFAIKCIQKKFIKLHLLEREIKIMKKLKHPHILPLIDVFETKDYIYLVLELVTGGELFDKIVERGNYTEKDASDIVRQILEAVQYLHSQGVVHRDLKPENLLCAEVGKEKETRIHIYVADFGLSRVFQDREQLNTYCGSPEYVAPEVLACVPYEKAVDLWSVGVITYILLTGFLPFYDKNHSVLFEKIQNVDYNWDDCPEVSPAAKHFIQHLLVKDPKKRYTAEAALNHPWLKGETAKLSMRPSFLDLMKEYNTTRKYKASPSSSEETLRK
jgi:calcium/calmodulin-dependent protein kinase I